MRTYRKIYAGTINILSTPICQRNSDQCVRDTLTRSFHSSPPLYDTPAAAKHVVCETLPDITVIWPFHMWPSDIAANLLNGIQMSSGLPWWASLLLGGVCAKCVMFSFNIYSYRKSQQFFRTSPKQLTSFGLTYLNNIVTKGEKISLKIANDDRRFTLFRATNRVRERMFSHISYKPLALVAGLHLSMFGGVHWLNRIQYAPLLDGGLPWCANLTVPDPYLILPVVCLATGLINFYYHPAHWMLPLPQFKPIHFVYLSPPLLVVFSGITTLSTDILLYLTAINCASTLFNIVLKHPNVHTEFGLLSSGEVLNRMIPTKDTFIDLSKTLDRQNLLLAQKKEQMLLLEQEQALIQDKSQHELLPAHTSDGIVNRDVTKHTKDQPDISFVKKDNLEPEESKSEPQAHHQAHHVQKVFKSKQELMF